MGDDDLKLSLIVPFYNEEGNEGKWYEFVFIDDDRKDIALFLSLGGIQLISLGIISEYLSKMYIQVKYRPGYLIKEYLDTKVK
ncbi:MAG: hypothetical protein K2I95_08625 [Treponemataceae bacterium]|nr:hypothetical protein [Treponemataceae bacterium]